MNFIMHFVALEIKKKKQFIITCYTSLKTGELAVYCAIKYVFVA